MRVCDFLFLASNLKLKQVGEIKKTRTVFTFYGISIQAQSFLLHDECTLFSIGKFLFELILIILYIVRSRKVKWTRVVFIIHAVNTGPYYPPFYFTQPVHLFFL